MKALRDIESMAFTEIIGPDIVIYRENASKNYSMNVCGLITCIEAFVMAMITISLKSFDSLMPYIESGDISWGI